MWEGYYEELEEALRSWGYSTIDDWMLDSDYCMVIAINGNEDAVVEWYKEGLGGGLYGAIFVEPWSELEKAVEADRLASIGEEL